MFSRTLNGAIFNFYNPPWNVFIFCNLHCQSLSGEKKTKKNRSDYEPCLELAVFYINVCCVVPAWLDLFIFSYLCGHGLCLLCRLCSVCQLLRQLLAFLCGCMLEPFCTSVSTELHGRGWVCLRACNYTHTRKNNNSCPSSLKQSKSPSDVQDLTKGHSSVSGTEPAPFLSQSCLQFYYSNMEVGYLFFSLEIKRTICPSITLLSLSPR